MGVVDRVRFNIAKVHWDGLSIARPPKAQTPTRGSIQFWCTSRISARQATSVGNGARTITNELPQLDGSAATGWWLLLWCAGSGKVACSSHNICHVLVWLLLVLKLVRLLGCDRLGWRWWKPFREQSYVLGLAERRSNLRGLAAWKSSLAPHQDGATSNPCRSRRHIISLGAEILPTVCWSWLSGGLVDQHNGWKAVKSWPFLSQFLIAFHSSSFFLWNEHTHQMLKQTPHVSPLFGRVCSTLHRKSNEFHGKPPAFCHQKQIASRAFIHVGQHWHCRGID